MTSLPALLCDKELIKPDYMYHLKAEALDLTFSRQGKLFSVSEIRTNSSELFLSIEQLEIKELHQDCELFSVPEQAEMSLSPALPDRPLIVRMKTPVTILPKTSITVYTELPLHIQFKIIGDSAPIKEIAVRWLSNSWLGDMSEGIKCYSLKSPALTELSQLPGDCTAVCPIILKNNSKCPVLFERLVIIPDDLAIYRIEERLWTDTLMLTYKGNNQSFNLTKATPNVAKDKLFKVSAARKPVSDKNFIIKALDALTSQ